MPKITYIEPSGTEAVIDVPEGWTLMQGASANGVDGIEAECGGSCACATCHCYVEEEHLSKLAPPAANELAMLENVAAERKSNSRLSCQIKVSAALDGLAVRLPERQS